MQAIEPFDAPRKQGSDAIPDFKKDARTAFFLTLTPIAAFLSLIAVAGIFNFPSMFFTLLAAGSALMSFCGLGLGARTIYRLLKIPRDARPAGLGFAIAAIPSGLFTTFLGAVSAMMSMMEFSRGRQLRKHSKLMFAPLSERSSWQGREIVGDSGSKAPFEVADAWRKNGLTEHASVAAFARLSIDLMALGAPPELIGAAHKDALDEMRHTELCFDLARSFDGRSLGPSEFRAAASLPMRSGPRIVRLTSLAVESLIDGAMNEGLSARVVAELSKEVKDPRVRSVLAAIARDEARHAAHGFDVVKWCLEEGGAPIASALRAAIAVMPEKIGAPLAPLAADGRFEKYGIPSRAREERAFAQVRSRLIARVERLLDQAPR